MIILNVHIFWEGHKNVKQLTTLALTDKNSHLILNDFTTKSWEKFSLKSSGCGHVSSNLVWLLDGASATEPPATLPCLYIRDVNRCLCHTKLWNAISWQNHTEQLQFQAKVHLILEQHLYDTYVVDSKQDTFMKPVKITPRPVHISWSSLYWMNWRFIVLKMNGL